LYARNPVDADFRNLWRPGSGLTLRRLFVLVKALPYEGMFKTEVRAAAEKALKPTVAQLRERQAFYAAQKQQA
jgi:hypothetical protein